MEIQEEKYLIPGSLQEAIQFAEEHEGKFKYIAGGTDIMVNRYQGNESAPCLIDLTKLKELKGIVKETYFLRIGALEVLEDLKFNDVLKSEFPLLIEAALSVGAPLLRKTATIGGNVLCENRCLFYNQTEWWREAIGYCLKCDGDICIATGGKNACFSELVSDTAPALIALNAEIEWMDSDGLQREKLEAIYTGDGVKPRNLPETAVVTAIFLPLSQTYRSYFKKLRERESLEFTSLTVAMTVDEAGKLKIVLGGVDPMPVVYEGTLSDDPAGLIKLLIKKARSVDNDMYSRGYRRQMIEVFVTQGLNYLQTKK